MKIAYILLSNGLEYDDRIRKEIFSMRKLIKNLEFGIFAFYGDNNHAETGVLSYGVPYEFVSVKHREGKRKDIISMLRKEYDFYSQIKPKVKDYDLLWICDEGGFFFPLFSNKPMIFDLHELPSMRGNWVRNLIFHRMERRCKWLIHANQERLNYLVQNRVVKRPMKNLVLRNYPDTYWLAESNKEAESFIRFRQWIGSCEYVYVQGIGSSARYPWETLSAIMDTKRIKVVVVGKVKEEIKRKLVEVYPNANDFVYYTGQLVQSDTAVFIANCKFSLIFYQKNTPNNRYCEPNRMFQCLGMGKPVIVGNNEPMKNVIEQYENGIVLNGDGGNISENVKAINEMLDNYHKYKANSEKSNKVFSWESQMQIFKQLFDL